MEKKKSNHEYARKQSQPIEALRFYQVTQWIGRGLTIRGRVRVAMAFTFLVAAPVLRQTGCTHSSVATTRSGFPPRGMAAQESERPHELDISYRPGLAVPD